MSIAANDPTLTSWVNIPEGSDFPIQNLPFGIFSPAQGTPRVGVAIGDQVVDLSRLAELGFLDGLGVDPAVWSAPVLNPFIELGKAATRAVRQRLSELLQSGNQELQGSENVGSVLLERSSVQLHLPVHVGDYTDFYSSIEHATNVGTMFRDPNNALLPNWKHIPVAYHGRASSIIPSGQAIHRPTGQTKADDAPAPSFGASRLLDFELEMAFITYPGKPLSERISTAEAEDYIFGMVLFNDWSARDIQKWEYVPLGPFLAKNFASSISPWVVTLDALEPFRVAGPEQDPPVLPYLEYAGEKNIDIALEVLIEPDNQPATRV
ncbi:MAG: fumarylacetoacetase, partial [Bacteroidota bacterium]